ncbi:hypothetical protein EDB83DRAFT_2521574 [Lactarius deliciosus]|nr:hypothetical protein EDB83DRAFT_2521574 [Lactarius deliciosus]
MFSHARSTVTAATRLSHQQFPLSPHNPSLDWTTLEARRFTPPSTRSSVYLRSYRRYQQARTYRSALPLASGSVGTVFMEESLLLQLLVFGLDDLNIGRYSLVSAYVVCFYDWIISLDQEVAFIYPAPWNVVKAAYLFCRYYPLAVAPFHFWGLFADHEQRVCESYYRVLFACTVPTILSAQFIMMLRTYAFSGRNKIVLAVLSITILGLFGAIIWVIGEHLTLSLFFIVVKRTGCFPISDQPDFVLVQGAGAVQGGTSPFVYYYHLGTISVRRCLSLVITSAELGFYQIITAFFDGLNMIIVFRSCRLVLMLRRKASPTETELRIEYSHMVNEALEMITVELHPEETSQDFLPSTSTYAQAQPPPDVYHDEHTD